MLEYHVYDVFTDRPFAGNPLAVVMGADGLSTAQMQVIAREFNLSETIFVMAPRDPANTARVRIFFPTAEIPFAGHPTIGCALHLANGQDGRILLEEEAGLVPVEIRGGQAEFIAPKLPVVHPGKTDAELIARALDLPEAAVGFEDHRPGIWQGGPAFLYVPIASLADLAAARPIEPFWSRLMGEAQVDSAYLYTPEDSGFRARMFSPTAGIPEDPATGSASAILAAQLLESGALPEDQTHIPLQQGVEMGRPSRIGLTAILRHGSLSEIRISGSAVPVAEGHIRIPEEA
ncbi:PhzF family phenazine biosynthesis protein [Paracoccus saliphilus]|uniref:PhzF family phenazine biosynthesis protein n=1 Tax=Paracoccus saliphilus TaxID=405559 RepID=A0AA46A4A5_9RHOB|nr:PhzF family phenazine biosynthesis protein [Paracoccus saliphilus]WCR03707.1 PhzF family phenazine biosynthesis protein [Paracoccus saliphilus]SIS58281.1 trans-2,3-dihydro-3-hydroxyanthranilate isomerase [Paracoccus saliphilus]